MSRYSTLNNNTNSGNKIILALNNLNKLNKPRIRADINKLRKQEQFDFILKGALVGIILGDGHLEKSLRRAMVQRQILDSE